MWSQRSQCERAPVLVFEHKSIADRPSLRTAQQFLYENQTGKDPISKEAMDDPVEVRGH